MMSLARREWIQDALFASQKEEGRKEKKREGKKEKKREGKSIKQTERKAKEGRASGEEEGGLLLWWFTD